MDLGTLLEECTEPILNQFLGGVLKRMVEELPDEAHFSYKAYLQKPETQEALVRRVRDLKPHVAMWHFEGTNEKKEICGVVFVQSVERKEWRMEIRPSSEGIEIFTPFAELNALPIARIIRE